VGSSLNDITLKQDLTEAEAAEIITDTLTGSDELKNVELARAEQEGVKESNMVGMVEHGELKPLISNDLNVDDYCWFTLAPVYIGLCMPTSLTAEFLESPRGKGASFVKCTTPAPISSRMPTWNDVIEGVHQDRADEFAKFLDTVAIQHDGQIWVLERTRIGLLLGSDNKKSLPLYIITPASATTSFCVCFDDRGGIALTPMNRGNARAEVHSAFTKEKLG